jgi:hypothetical protein
VCVLGDDVLCITRTQSKRSGQPAAKVLSIALYTVLSRCISISALLLLCVHACLCERLVGRSDEIGFLRSPARGSVGSRGLSSSSYPRRVRVMGVIVLTTFPSNWNIRVTKNEREKSCEQDGERKIRDSIPHAITGENEQQKQTKKTNRKLARSCCWPDSKRTCFSFFFLE